MRWCDLTWQPVCWRSHLAEIYETLTLTKWGPSEGLECESVCDPCDHMKLWKWNDFNANAVHLWILDLDFIAVFELSHLCFSCWILCRKKKKRIMKKKLKISLYSLSPSPEQIRCCRSRCETLQFPAHAPKPWRQETALYWGKTPLFWPSHPPHPCSLTPWSHPYLPVHCLHSTCNHTVRAGEEAFSSLHSKTVQTLG